MIKVKRYTAKWCDPCRQLAPLFIEIEKLFPNVSFETIDVDLSPEEVQNHFVTSVPTIIIFKDGVAKHRYVGIQPKSMYIDTINSLI